VDGVQVHLEPFVPGTQGRDDIRIIESAFSVLSGEDIDITIVSLASLDFQTAIPTLGNHRVWLCGPKGRHTRSKTPQRRGKGTPAPAPAFGPNIQASRALPRWYDGNGSEERAQAREVDHDGAYYRLVRRFPLSLLRARARCFEP
jgi:hypothetical protein